MAARATWKGFLKISLVNIPIKVFPATESSATISFNQLHGECQTRIQQKRWCPHCNREVPNSEIVKGYEFEKGRYVVLSEDDGKMAADAFAVMRDGMKGKVGVGKLALYGREYLVAVRPHQRGIVMYTLHHAAEIRSIDGIEELDTVAPKVKPEEIKLARQVIDTFHAPLNLASYKDEYREGLQKIIDAKIAGEEVVAPDVEAPPKVVNLMEALRKSLDAVSTGKKRPVKAETEKPVAKRKRA
jgi:DNA end-binding protein Ku